MKDVGGADGECACGRRRSDGRARLRAAWAVARPREGLQEDPVRPIDMIGEGAIGNQPSVVQMSQLLTQRATTRYGPYGLRGTVAKMVVNV